MRRFSFLNSNLEQINSLKLVGFTDVTLTDISNDANNLSVGQTVSFGVTDGKALLNTPFQNGGRIYCIYALGNRPLQIAFIYTSGKMYIRAYYSSWSEWKGVTFDA